MIDRRELLMETSEKTSPDRGKNASVRGKGNGRDAEQSVQAREIPNETEILGLCIL